MTDYNLDQLGAKVAELERMMGRLALADQLSSTTIGGEDAVDVGDALDTAADASTAIPQLQDDVDEYGGAVSDLGENIAEVMVDLDARLDAGAASLELAREEIEEAQAEVDAAFGVRLDGMSQDIDRAITSADGKALILFSTSDPSGTAPTGSTWFRIDTVENVAGQWQQTGTVAAPVWTPRLINSAVIANLDVAKLTAGNAAIATLVAQKIAASTASFQQVNVANLFVTSGATMQQAVIDYLFANVVAAKKITADMIDVNSLSGVTLTGTIVRTASSGPRILLRNETLNGATQGVLRFYNSDADGDSIPIIPTTGGLSVGNPGDGDYGLRAGVLPDTSLPGGVISTPSNQPAQMPRTVTSYTRTLRVSQEMAAPRIYDPATGRILLDDSAWATLLLASAYTGARNPAASRIGQIVFLRGQVQRTNGAALTTADTNLFTLPVQYRPAQDMIVDAGGPAGFTPRLSIGANGVVGINALPNGYTASYIILDSIVSYRIN